MIGPVPLTLRRRARNLIADELDRQGRHDDARLTRAGMRDNAASEVLAVSFWVAGEQLAKEQIRSGIAGTLVGMAIGYLAAYILFV